MLKFIPQAITHPRALPSFEKKRKEEQSLDFKPLSEIFIETRLNNPIVS